LKCSPSRCFAYKEKKISTRKKGEEPQKTHHCRPFKPARRLAPGDKLGQAVLSRQVALEDGTSFATPTSSNGFEGVGVPRKPIRIVDGNKLERRGNDFRPSLRYPLPFKVVDGGKIMLPNENVVDELFEGVYGVAGVVARAAAAEEMVLVRREELREVFVGDGQRRVFVLDGGDNLEGGSGVYGVRSTIEGVDEHLGELELEVASQLESGFDDIGRNSRPGSIVEDDTVLRLPVGLHELEIGKGREGRERPLASFDDKGLLARNVVRAEGVLRLVTTVGALAVNARVTTRFNVLDDVGRDTSPD
jgi:hypothetical protein